jgi:hypothetical protein
MDVIVWVLLSCLMYATLDVYLDHVCNLGYVFMEEIGYK